MDVKETREALILGALLHDIGKFWQRADPQLNYERSENISAQTRNNVDQICPKYQGLPTHKHSLWTNEFFNEYQTYLPPIVKVGEATDNAANFAAYHHNPGSVLQTIIQQADWLSSGMDRRSCLDGEDEVVRFGFKKTRLESIFDKINLGHPEDIGNQHEKRDYVYALGPLGFDGKGTFPILKGDSTDLTAQYRQLWDAFINEFKQLPDPNRFDLYLESLLSLCEKYTWCIPSSTVDVPDISLYDHSRTTAAIAVCLYDFHHATNTLDERSVRDRSIPKFRLIGGDLSGIQKYIFNLMHTNIKALSKILRARSFYLSQLPVVSVHYILHELGLPPLCNIMDAGGRFILLAPDTPAVLEELRKLYPELSAWYKAQFCGELTLNLNWDTVLTGEDFFQKNFARIIPQLNHAIETEKLRKLSEVNLGGSGWNPAAFCLDENYDKYEHGVCSCCGKLPGVHKIEPEDEEDFRRLCQQCDEQRKLGRWLTQPQLLLAYSRQRPTNQSNTVAFFNGKYWLSFLESPENVSPSEFYLVEQIYGMSRTTYFKTRFLSNHVPILEAHGLCAECRSKGACQANVQLGHAMAFECMAKSGLDRRDDRLIGKPMLGVLKADVDRLGYIFSIGLGEQMSVSRYTTLSRMLNLFFTGYINEVLRKEPEFNRIYTVYAGGDDLFLIGEWKQIINFSQRLYNDFHAYACKNPNVHLSAGIATIHSKFPINRAAEWAEELLEDAKRERDRLTLFKTTINWDELYKLQEFARFLDAAVNDPDSKIKSGFLYRLLQYHRMFEAFDKDKKVEGLRFHSLMAYDVARNIVCRDHNGSVLNQDELNQLYRIFDAQKMDKSLMLNLKIPLFWTIYKNRGGK